MCEIFALCATDGILIEKLNRSQTIFLEDGLGTLKNGLASSKRKDFL
jgi:hypothetical protein